jgi:hypothetical protein
MELLHQVTHGARLGVTPLCLLISAWGRQHSGTGGRGAHRHDPVGEVEGLLDAVPVVDVDVDVQHARVHLEQLQDGQHDVVHVAEARGLALLGVVHAPCACVPTPQC